MSPEVTLAGERRRRKAAETEASLLRVQLGAFTAAAALDLALVDTPLDQNQQWLHDESGLVRLVIDASPNLVYVEDEQGQCILANKSYARLLSQQASHAEPAGSSPGQAQVVHPTEVATSFEETYHLQDGQTVWYYTTKSPLIWADGSRYLLTFSSDITDLKQAHRVAEEAAQAKQVFMATMSHEIRTPLHGVMGLAALLMKEPLSAVQSGYIEMIQYSTENLLVVINDMMDFTRLESGKISLESIPFNVLKVVQDAARSLTSKMNEKGLVLHIVSPSESLPLAQGDPFRLHQVLVNLIGNAIKFTLHGTITITITIEAEQQANGGLPVTFSIADTGIGISTDNLRNVFSSFQQADSSIPRLYGGTGLGLSICKTLIELQGGQIAARSEPDQGSCFYFTIPYAVGESPQLQEPLPVQPPNVLKGLKILLAEDNAINQLIAAAMLGLWHVSVDVAEDGKEALAKAHECQYDLILLDIQMPQLDGIATAARLRQEAGPNRDTPIIALTADAIRINANSYQALGFTHYLTKPYSEAALYTLVAQVSRRTLAPVQFEETPSGPVTPGLHYDFSLLGRLATDAVFIRKMLELFITRVPGQVQVLHNAAEANNWAAVNREVHSLKTTFGSLNIQPVSDLLKRMGELAERHAPKSEVQPLINAILKATFLFSELFLKRLAQSPRANEPQHEPLGG